MSGIRTHRQLATASLLLLAKHAQSVAQVVPAVGVHVGRVGRGLTHATDVDHPGVDLGGGLDGLVHMSEVSWSRGVRPHDVAKPGDEVDVEVLDLRSLLPLDEEAIHRPNLVLQGLMHMLESVR